MTVLLTILKVIGWILLGILGLILLTVLTVLLVPIRYRADGVWKEEKYIRGRVTWLLHLLSIRVTYEKELLLEVRVAGFLIYPKKERSGKKKKAASGADAEEGVGDADADTNVLDADGAKMPSADVKTLGESAPAAGTTDEPQTQTVAEASEPQSADPRGSATTRMPDVESRLLRRLTRKLPIRTLRPNILPAAFLKSFPVSFRRSQTDCAECSKRPTSSNNRLPIIKESGISRRHGRRSGLDFTSWEKLSDMYCRESWRFLESSGQAIRLLPDRSWRYRECCIPGIKEISGWNRILKRNISKESFTSKAESGLEPSESAD